MTTPTVRPTARLTGIGWGLAVAGVALLVLSWVVTAWDTAPRLAPALALPGWVALITGVITVIWAAVRKAHNRDILQAR